MFNAGYAENELTQGAGVLETADGAGGTGTDPRFVPLKRSVLTGTVTGPLASLDLVQIFGYTRSVFDRPLAAIHRFPLPGNAAVKTVRVAFGDVEIRTSLKCRVDAEDDFEQALQEGRQAALLTRETADVFTLHISGILPDQDVRIETTYVELARAEGVGWSLRLPLTTAPRYVRSDEASTFRAQGQPLFPMRDPGHRFSLRLSFPGAGSV